MKVLIVNWIYNWGSTGYILRDLKNGLQSRGIDVCVASGVCRGDEKEVFVFSSDREMATYGKLSRLGLSKLRGSTKASKRLIRYIKSEKPDVVHLHLLNCTIINLYHLLCYLGENQIKTILTNHAELYYTGTCGHAFDCNKWINDECKGCKTPKQATDAYLFACPHYHWKRMKKSLARFSSDNLRNTAVSPWLRNRIIQSSMMNRFPCDVVLNGVDIEVFKQREAKDQLAEKLGNRIKKYAVFVSANFDPVNKNDIKGGCYILELAKMLPEITFVIVATSFSNVENLPANIVFWGKAKNQVELAELYSNAKMTVIASQRETFSMVCAESLCCGTPVVGFLAGGPESIAIPEYSAFVEYADLDSLKNIIEIFYTKQFDSFAISKTAIAKFSRKAMTDGYIESYKKILGI